MESIVGLWLIFVFNFAFCLAHPFDERLKSNLDKTNPDCKSNESFFEQKLDHFDPNNGQTWMQRYWYNDSCQKSRSAALLFIHDPHTVSEMDIIDEKFLHPLAENLNASRFYLEHRFYGESKPKNDTSLTSLRYLSAEQALADIANFIEKITEQSKFPVDNGVKWVVLGLSYGGTLATWARYKYPHLITSAVAINAPLLTKVDFAEYYQNVVNSLKSYSQTCAEKVAIANKKLKQSIENVEFRRNIPKMFQLCDDVIENSGDVSNLFAELAKNFAYAVDLTGMSKRPRDHASVSKLCNMMENSSLSSLDSYAEVNKLDLRGRLDPVRNCFDYRYDCMMEKLKEIEYDDKAKISRQWMYQLCTEFGFFASSSDTSEIFGDHFPATFFEKQCQELFGPEFNLAYIEKKVSSNNKKYGGLQIDVNQTIFIYNSEDPWRSLFITQNKTGSYEVLKFHENIYSQNGMQLKMQYGGYFGWSDGFLSKLDEVGNYLGCVLHGSYSCTP